MGPSYYTTFMVDYPFLVTLLNYYSTECLIYRNGMWKCIMNPQYIRFFLKLNPQQLPKEMGLCGVSNSLSLWLSASFFSSLERYENISCKKDAIFLLLAIRQRKYHLFHKTVMSLLHPTNAQLILSSCVPSK